MLRAVVDVAGAVEATRLNPARGARTCKGSFNAGDAGSLAAVTLTNRAGDSARRSSKIEDGEKLNGERGECHIRARSPCLEGLARDGAELGEDQVLRWVRGCF